MPTLDLACVQPHTHVSGCFFYSIFRSTSITHTQTSGCVLEICLMVTHTYTHLLYPCPRLIACTNAYFPLTFTGAFHLHACGITCNYLFHQCATSLLSRDGRIADCTVRHPGVERLFSSFNLPVNV